MSISLAIVLFIVCFLVGTILAWFLFQKKYKGRIYTDEISRITNLEIAASLDLSKREGIQDYKKSDEYKALNEIEYLKGIEEGEKKALNRFAIKYDDYERTTETFFNKKIDIGYTMQIFYDGFPIGEPMVRIVYHNEKFKDENVKYLVGKVQETIQQIQLQAATRGIPVLVNEKKKSKK